jgi:FKBP-type peptidyl-prolyl cis-trans isomerase
MSRFLASSAAARLPTAARIFTRLDVRPFTRSAPVRVEEKFRPFYVLGLEVGSQFGKLREDLKDPGETKAFIKGIADVLGDSVDQSIVADHKKYADIVSQILNERRTLREGPAKEAATAEAQEGSKSLLARAAAESGATVTSSGLIVNHLVSGSGAYSSAETGLQHV